LNYPELARRVRAEIGQRHRYEHSVRVARCAELLALRHGLETRQARLAGMLHDLARLYSGERLIAECERRGLAIDSFERNHPFLLHAKVSAAIAKERFGVGDPQVLSAIGKHTTAAAAMSPLDCVVYLADSLEPLRTFPERAALWDLAKRDLTSAMRETLIASFGHLRTRGMPIAPQTLAAAVAFGVEVREREASTS
jgi:predicted HD superfamily hydrolase involved in NAD metabolism